MSFQYEHEFGRRLTLRVFGSPASLAEALVGRVQEAVMTGVRQRGQARLLVDGAPVLRRCFELLAATDLPWRHVTVTLLAPEADAPAAEHLLRNSLLLHHASAATLRLGLTADDTASTDPHDLVLLALTPDGHLPAWRTSPQPGGPSTTAGAPGAGVCGIEAMALDGHRIVIAAQGLRARDAFERQALAVEASDSALQAWTQHALQPIELCWCR